MLAYTFLLKHPKGLDAKALDTVIESWFSNKFQCQLDFEISDALDKLTRMQLVAQQGELYIAVELAAAKQLLDKHWDGIFDYN